MIGHHLYRSPGPTSVAQQMVEAHTRHQTSIIGVQRSDLADVHLYGCVAGAWMREAESAESVAPVRHTEPDLDTRVESGERRRALSCKVARPWSQWGGWEGSC